MLCKKIFVGVRALFKGGSKVSVALESTISENTITSIIAIANPEALIEASLSTSPFPRTLICGC
jgi:hypothetical protein